MDQSEGIRVFSGVRYSRSPLPPLEMDLAAPTASGPLPAVLFIHGGGFAGGSRESYLPGVREAARRGYAAATMSYRFAPEHPYPAQLNDAKLAFARLKEGFESVQIDAARTAVVGSSAGGTLALWLAFCLPADDVPAAIVNIGGPTDLRMNYEVSPATIGPLLGGAPDEMPEAYREASPISHVTAVAPPILSLYGELDPRLAQGLVLDERMTELGAAHTLVIRARAGHDDERTLFAPDDVVWAFLQRHLCLR